MALHCRLFAGVPELEACLVNDQAHLTAGTTGHHVRLVQEALVKLGFNQIDGRDYIDGVYGASTAAAVLRYKTSRQIINRAYQSSPDNIVGKMTIKSLDTEMLARQNFPTPSML
ncbi:peptidoglycan-binding protein [Labrys sp. LIt4]|uniref:peptidoglycan-binding domain-containing protein n=1 Tax=Labrys sp. LIt4 TaxID=2821355 RepID=UPI001ADFD01B|nr:peptidoglycan-binding domain-containing protein [Labrys sp. LIt4]MBP0580445.1 peptidoglycan-binding protein [Labrys sp. LIt4]